LWAILDELRSGSVGRDGMIPHSPDEGILSAPGVLLG
jgi:hypothetical protein